MTMKRKAYPMIDNQGGLNISLDPVLLADKDSPYAKEVRYHKGVVKKDLGLASFETTPVVGTPMLKDTFYTTTGYQYDILMTTRHLYEWDDTKLNWKCITIGTDIDLCESGWADLSGGGVTVSHVSDSKEGTNCVKMAIKASHTTGLVASKEGLTVDLSNETAVHFWVKSSINLAAGDVHFHIDEDANLASPSESIDLPALVAGVWTRVALTYAAASSTRNAVVSVGFGMAVDKGAFDLYVDHIRSCTPYTGDEDDRFCMAVMNDYAIITNGFDPIVKYNGTTVSLLTGIVTGMRAFWIFPFMSRLVACGTRESGTDYPQRVRWSSVGTIDNWTTGTSGYVDLIDTSDWCTCGAILGPRGYVYKERSIWELQYVGGTTVFSPINRIDGIGTLAANSLINLGDEHAFWGSDNVYTFDGLKVDPLAKKIYPWLYETGEKVINNSKVNRSAGVFVEELNQYWIVLPTAANTTPDRLFKYDFSLDNWAVTYDVDITAFGYWQSASTQITWATAVGAWSAAVGSWKRRSLPSESPTTLLFSSTGLTYEDDRATSSSNEMVYDTKDFIWAHAVRVVECRIQARYGPFTIKYSADGGLTWSTGTTFGYVDDWTEFVYTEDLNVTTQRVRFRITCTASEFELMWLEPWYIERVRSKTLATS